MRFLTSLVAALALGITSTAPAQVGDYPSSQRYFSASDNPPNWIRGTAIELMVIKEVNSRTAKAGDKVLLRVNAPVKLDDLIAIPVGAMAHAEVISVSGTSAAGGKGQISLRLSGVETQWGLVKLSGTKGTQGAGNTGGVVLSVIGFGLFGLLNKGGNASFKGGEIITGYIDEGVNPASEPLQLQVPNSQLHKN